MLESAVPTAPIAPGRPETLTKAEEAKLKELWGAVLKVFGVATVEDAGLNAGAQEANSVENVTADLSAAEISQENTDPRKKKKDESKRSKFSGLLSRSKKDKERDKEESVTPAVQAVGAAIDEKEDKYGQTKDFKAALATQGPAELRQSFWKMVICENPDGLLLRFLRARKWDVEKALVMIVGTMQWRSNEMKVHDVVFSGENAPIAAGDEDFMKQLRVGKSFIHGLDKDGRPICHVRVRLHKAGEQSEESMERYTVFIMETARLMLDNHVDTAALVFDMTGFSMANMDYPPVKFMIKCFEAHYPESLGVCVVHKAPWIFQGIWTLIKSWLDPVVASKIHFTKTQEDLEQFIPKEHIIKELGGPEDWEYVYQEPAPGEDAALEDKETLSKLETERAEIIKKYEALTRAWINELPEASTGETSSAPEVLSNLKIKEERFEIAKELRDGYWRMDKHIRGRTIYDRTGVIAVGASGKVGLYATKAPAASVEKVIAAATS